MISPEKGSFAIVLEYRSSRQAATQPAEFQATSEIEKLITPMVSRYLYDEINHTNEHLFDEVLVAQQSDGKVIFTLGESGVRLVNLTDILGETNKGEAAKPSGLSSTMLDVEIAGRSYKVFMQPVQLSIPAGADSLDAGVRWVVCGLVSATHLTDQTFAVSYTVVIAFFFLLVMALLSMPLLKLKLMGPKDRLTRGNLWSTMLAAVVGSAVEYAYSLELVNSRNTGENVAIISTTVPGSKWVSCMDTRLVSLVQTVLPAGYGYCVIDAEGKVLFHSQEVKNLEEHFLEECRFDGELRSALLARADGFVSTKYLGRGHRLYVTPLADLPWSLVVFRDQQMLRTINLEILTLSFILFFGFGVLMLVLIVVLRAVRPEERARWMWPDQSLRRRYGGIVVANLVLGLALLPWMMLGEGWSLILLSVIVPAPSASPGERGLQTVCRFGSPEGGLLGLGEGRCSQSLGAGEGAHALDPDNSRGLPLCHSKGILRFNNDVPVGGDRWHNRSLQTLGIVRPEAVLCGSGLAGWAARGLEALTPSARPTRSSLTAIS